MSPDLGLQYQSFIDMQRLDISRAGRSSGQMFGDNVERRDTYASDAETMGITLFVRLSYDQDSLIR